MTLRDRLVLTGVIVLAVIGAAWVLAVSPERKKANELNGQLATAKSQLSAAESQLSSARHAQARYSAAYSTIVSLGKAVPTSQEVPSLIYQLAQASNQKDVQFASITTVAGSGGAGSSATGTAGAAAAGFSQLPFTFVFNGSYFGLEHMLHELAGLTTRTRSGALRVNGRLLTIQSVKLAPQTESGKSKALSATIVASAYQLPAEAGAGTAAASPGAAPAASGASTSPTAPAIVRVKP